MSIHNRIHNHLRLHNLLVSGKVRVRAVVEGAEQEEQQPRR